MNGGKCRGTATFMRQLGMVTILHCLETCLAIGMEIGSPRLTDDSKFQYAQNFTMIPKLFPQQPRKRSALLISPILIVKLPKKTNT